MLQRHRKLVNKLGTRQGRRKSGFFLVEGARCCGEALTHCGTGVEVVVISESLAGTEEGRALTLLARQTGRPADVVPDAELSGMAATDSPQGVLCVLQRPARAAPSREDPFVLILDRVSEPGNLGTILRTAQAIGLRQVWLISGTTDPFGAKAVRAGMGAQFRLTFPAFESLCAAAAAAAGLDLGPVWCAVPRGGVGCFSEEFRLPGGGLVIGNEAGGIGDLSVGPAVSIPMPGGAESLNAAQAATVLLVETVRRGWLPARADAGTGPTPGGGH